MKKFYWLLLFIFLSLSAFAQDKADSISIVRDSLKLNPNPTAKRKTIVHAIKIRKAFESLDDRDEPAVLSFTLPTKGKDSYLINGGISYNIFVTKHKPELSTRLNLEAFIVFNRNNLVDEEQYNIKTGLSGAWMLGKLNMKEKKNRYWLLNTTAEYMNNRIDTSQSILATAYVSLVSKTRTSKLVLNQYKDFGKKGFQYFLQVNTGPEGQRIVDAKEEAIKGYAAWWYYGAELRLSKKIKDRNGKLPASMGKRFAEIIFSQKGRFLLFDSFDGKDYLPLTKIELAVYPTLSSDFAFGLSYNNGSDPIAAMPDQEYYLLAVKFKL